MSDKFAIITPKYSEILLRDPPLIVYIVTYVPSNNPLWSIQFDKIMPLSPENMGFNLRPDIYWAEVL